MPLAVDCVAVVDTDVLQPSDLVGPTTLDLRLNAIRKRRTAARLSEMTTLAIWIAGLAALVIVAGGGLLNIR